MIAFRQRWFKRGRGPKLEKRLYLEKLLTEERKLMAAEKHAKRTLADTRNTLRLANALKAAKTSRK